MKKIFLSIGFYSLIAIANAQVSSVAAADPHAGHDHGTTEVAKVISVEPATPVKEDFLSFKESDYDFGKIPQGKPVTHVFEVKNISKVSFKLDNVAASCGCTTPQWDKDKVINPGQTSEITVGYNAAAEGPFTKNVTVTYNGTQSKVMIIKGEVWKTPAASAPANTGLNDIKN